MARCCCDLAPEAAVGEDEVDHSQHHAYTSPDQAHRQAVLRSRGVVDGQAICRVDGWQDQRIQAEGCAGQHPQDECAGREQSGHVALPESEIARAKEAHKRDQRKDNSPGSLAEARVNLWLHEERGNAGQDRQGNCYQPAYTRDAPRALVQHTLRLDGNVVCSVHHERGEGQQAGQDGIPVQDARICAKWVEVCP